VSGSGANALYAATRNVQRKRGVKVADGKGCKCAAYDESECGCDADWTPQEVYDLRESNARLLGLIADIRAAVGDPTGKLMQDELVEHCKQLRLNDDQREAILAGAVHLERELYALARKGDLGGERRELYTHAITLRDLLAKHK